VNNHFKNGLSFIEILTAVTLIAVGLVPVFMLFGTTASDISITTDELFATTYANELLDGIHAHKYEEIPGRVDLIEVEKLDDPFFRKLQKGLSPLNKGFKRFIEISTSEFPFKTPQKMNPFRKEKFEKLNKFKIIKIYIKYSQNNKPKDLKMGIIVTAS